MTDTTDWKRDRRRFVTDADEAHRNGVTPLRDHGFPQGPLGQQFAALTQTLLDARTVEDVVDQVVAAAAAIAPQADTVSITLRSPNGAFHTPVATDDVARRADELQYELGEGPCVTAALASGPAMVACPDLAGPDAPWPRFAPAAHALGIEAVLSLSLIPAPSIGRLSGALNLFSRVPDGLHDVDQDAMLLLATHASLALATTTAVTVAGLREAQLRKAIDSRDVIGQAKGVLMGRRGLTASAAFDVLRDASQRLNVKLVKIAELVTTQLDILD